MPLYEFVDDKTNEVREFYFEMKSAPAIGTLVTRKGTKWRRIVGRFQGSEDVKNVVHGYPYVSNQHCRKAQGAGDYTPEGKPIITSRCNEREFMARHDLVRD